MTAVTRMSVPPSMLVGVAEVATELGCHKQQLHSIRKKPGFPAPLVTLAATPIWDLRDIRQFKDGWKRRKKRTLTPVP
jgi:hypothetical protein